MKDKVQYGEKVTKKLIALQVERSAARGSFFTN